MIYISGVLIRRIPREGFKSLVVSVLALVLVFLISIMGSVRYRQAVELEYVIDNFEVSVEVSHPIGRNTEGLMVGERFINLFTYDGAPYSLAGFLKNTQLRREFAITIPFLAGDFVELMDVWLQIEPPRPTPPEAPLPQGRITGITSLLADPGLNPAGGVFIDFFAGHDESVFLTGERVVVVSEGIFRNLDPEDLVLTFTVWGDHSAVEGAADAFVLWRTSAEMQLQVIGVVHGAEEQILAPFWAVSELWEASTGQAPYSTLMNALIADNRLIDEFTQEAKQHFAAAGAVVEGRPHALTVFDSVYNDVVRTLRQNIMLLDTVMPLVFGLSVCVGFVTSFLLTRRRRGEFAVMRSIGVRKSDVFCGALAEQFILSLTGAVAGCLLFFAVGGEFLPVPAAIFTVCYTLGAIASAAQAAGTNVLKILRA